MLVTEPMHLGQKGDQMKYVVYDGRAASKRVFKDEHGRQVGLTTIVNRLNEGQTAIITNLKGEYVKQRYITECDLCPNYVMKGVGVCGQCETKMDAATLHYQAKKRSCPHCNETTYNRFACSECMEKLEHGNENGAYLTTQELIGKGLRGDFRGEGLDGGFAARHAGMGIELLDLDFEMEQ
jgi:hypothetical protein